MKTIRSLFPVKVLFPFLVIVIFTSLTGCNLPQKVSLEAIQSGPRAWIDAPRHQSVLPLAPYEIVFHGSDPGGVALAELNVNGQVLANIPNPDASGRLVTFRQIWNPPGPGVYTISSRTQNAAGGWSELASVEVTIGEPTITITPTFTETPTFTPTATLEASPTVTDTPTPTITSTPDQLILTGSASPNQVFYGCGQGQVTFSVQVNHPERVAAIYIFLRLQDQYSGQQTAWGSSRAMNAASGQSYTQTYDVTHIEQYDLYDLAYLMYQYVAVDTQQNVIGRSQIYQDVSMSRCGGLPEPVAVTPTPTKGIFIIDPEHPFGDD